jgi:hypothetical protein
VDAAALAVTFGVALAADFGADFVFADVGMARMWAAGPA